MSYTVLARKYRSQTFDDVMRRSKKFNDYFHARALMNAWLKAVARSCVTPASV